MIISKFQYITQEVKGSTHSELAESACKGGVDWVQLRIKNKSQDKCLEAAIKTEAICKKYHAKFIINDHVSIVKTVRADGVHLGQSDMSVREARTILGDSYIIGGTANTFEDIKKLANEGVNYIGLGPFRFTETKKNLSPLLGIEGYVRIMEECKKHNITIPIIAIGGITLTDVESIIKTGVYGIAVSSAINLSERKHETIKRFFNRIQLATPITN